MNILFFLHPKQEVAYVYDDCTLRQVLETMEHHKYASIPMLNRQGEYVGTKFWLIARLIRSFISESAATAI